MRFLYLCAVIYLGFLGVGAASADDNGAILFQFFAKTCAKKPISAIALDAQARGLGYVHKDGPVAADDPNRDPDDLHFWKLPNQGSDFAISAYFTGSRAHYSVSCSMKADDVDGAAFLAILKSETTLADPQSTKQDPDKGSSTYSWKTDEDGAHDVLEIGTFNNGRVSISLTYDVIAR